MSDLFSTISRNVEKRIDVLRCEIDPQNIFFKTIEAVSVSTIYEIFEVDKREIEGLEFLLSVYDNIRDDLYYHINERNEVFINDESGSKNIEKLCKFMYLVEAKNNTLKQKLAKMGKEKTDNIDQFLKKIKQEIRDIYIEAN